MDNSVLLEIAPNQNHTTEIFQQGKDLCIIIVI